MPEDRFHHVARGIIRKGDYVLLVKAAGYVNTFLPGGHIEFGESAKTALKREMKEELGISCLPSKFLGVIEHKWKEDGILNCELNQIFEVESNEISTSFSPPSKEEHLQFIWCSRKDLDTVQLEPAAAVELLKKHMDGSQGVWWESNLS